MAQFRAVIQGQRGEASRLGGLYSGIRAQVRGWDSGVDVYGHTENQDDPDKRQDIFEISANQGNGWNSGQRSYIGRVYANGDTLVFQDANGKRHKLT